MVVIVSILGVALAVTPLVILILDRTGRLGPDLKDDLWRRYVRGSSWCLWSLCPILLGAAWSLLLFTVLSLLSFREFAGATGLFREKLMSLLVVIGILSLTFAVADHLVSSVRRAHSHEHRRDHGGGHVARPAQGIHPARRTGDLRLHALRNLPGPPFLHDQRHTLSFARLALDLLRAA